jgi:hypothetical protein
MLRRILPKCVQLLGFGLALSLALAGNQALAAQEVVLLADQSQIVTLPEPPTTLMVGNPAIANVTTDGRSLFLHPRAYGVTNVIALDANGKRLGDYIVRVIYQDSYSVSMYSPLGRETYTCLRDCDPALRIGDGLDHFASFALQATNKNKLAIDQATGDDPVRTPTAPTSTPYFASPSPQ